MSSRLFTEVRERRGLAYYVFGRNQGYTDTGSLYAQAGVDIDRIDEAITTIVAELRRIAAEPVPADELEKARDYAKGRFVLWLESPHGTIMFGLRREVLEGEADEPDEVLAGLDAVTAEDVQRVAHDILDDDACTSPRSARSTTRAASRRCSPRSAPTGARASRSPRARVGTWTSARSCCVRPSWPLRSSTRSTSVPSAHRGASMR